MYLRLRYICLPHFSCQNLLV